MAWTGTPGSGSLTLDDYLNINPSGATANTLLIKGKVIQAFRVKVRNASGTLKHRIGRPDGMPASNLAAFRTLISGATSATENTTPNGADASTDFTAGLKIGSANTNVLWLNTPNQDITTTLAIMSMAENITGSYINVQPYQDTVNINGTTRYRLGMYFTDLSGNAWAVNTTNIANGKHIDVQVLAWLDP